MIGFFTISNYKTMSKTIRKVTRLKEIKNSDAKYSKFNGVETVELDDTQNAHQIKPHRGKKLKPYTKHNKWGNAEKYPVRTYMYQAGGHDRKEAIANANRSNKKAYRQELKRQLKKELNEVQNDTLEII
jgi:hypothetical protein